MANVTIGDLTLVTSAAAGDLIEIQTAGGLSRAISKANYIGATLTGGGTLALGGFTATVPATGTLALKTGAPSANNVAAWNDANTLKDGGFALTDIARLSQAASFAGKVTGAVGFNSIALGIADDTVADIPFTTSGLIMVYPISNNSMTNRYLIGAFRANASPLMISISIGTDFAVTTGTLTGTTGTDGKATISAANGHLYIENRLGSAITFGVMLFV